ncbi:hypothetical protein QBC37DRAFT_82838 [Rhypophila decipiens]|uniref:Uncharacterized protein n=1 Tax=Rhypophila decipiens TaxID=261697 RepID=A0AAN7B2Q6_9PEZI|nr:hypothetical protein QBC37DRAFT_82838 [Rhypophila decipiens]
MAHTSDAWLRAMGRIMCGILALMSVVCIRDAAERGLGRGGVWRSLWKNLIGLREQESSQDCCGRRSCDGEMGAWIFSLLPQSLIVSSQTPQTGTRFPSSF